MLNGILASFAWVEMLPFVHQRDWFSIAFSPCVVQASWKRSLEYEGTLQSNGECALEGGCHQSHTHTWEIRMLRVYRIEGRYAKMHVMKMYYLFTFKEHGIRQQQFWAERRDVNETGWQFFHSELFPPKLQTPNELNSLLQKFISLVKGHSIAHSYPQHFFYPVQLQKWDCFYMKRGQLSNSTRVYTAWNNRAFGELPHFSSQEKSNSFKMITELFLKGVP